MMYFEVSKLSKLKAAQLQEIIDMYVKGGFVIEHPDDVKTNTDKINTIKVAIEKCGGYPHLVTKEDLERNDMVEEGEEIKEGDVIFLPFVDETISEEEIRKGLLADAETLLSDDFTAEELQHKLTELDLLNTEELSKELTNIREGKGMPIAPSELKNQVDSVPKDTTSTNTQKPAEKPTKANSEALDTKSEYELLKSAVETGQFKHENVTIIGFQPKIVFGKTRYELYGHDGATYIIDKEMVRSLVASVL